MPITPFGQQDKRLISSVSRGFTLVELLVVAAIISLLAAILFPVFSRVRENARRASCQSNIRQITLGAAQYLQDFDEKYPGNASLAGGVNNQCWHQMIQPYTRSKEVFHCPSDPQRSSPGTCGSQPYANFPLSYGVNNNFSVNNGGILASKVASPATTMYLADGFSDISDATKKAALPTDWGENRSAFIIDSWESTLLSATGGNHAGPFPRHLDMVNIGFADGHVKAMTIEKWYYSSTPWMDPTKGG